MRDMREIARAAPLLCVTVVLLACCGSATAGSFPLDICGASARDPGNWVSDPGDGLSSTADAGFQATAQCPYNSGIGLFLAFAPNRRARDSVSAGFTVTAPAGIEINSIHGVHTYSAYVGSNGWWGEFYWNGGPGPAGRSGPINSIQFDKGGCCSQTGLNSRSIGWFIACGQSHCSSGGGGISLGMSELQLTAQEDQAPEITPSGPRNLWYQQGWVRGRWSASFTARDPSGVCGAALVFGNLPAILTPTPDTAPNRHTWKQCPDQSVPATVDTTASDGSLGRSEGAMPLRLAATNTGNVTASPTKTVYVDNTNPAISLSGPTDTPSTAGTQYITATAAGSPSGIADIICTVNGGPAEIYPGAAAEVPVAGIGRHTISCNAENNAVDPSGARGRSSTANWSLKIGQPTLAGISFSRLVGLRCHRARVRVKFAGHWVTVQRHGHLVRVKTRTRTKVVSLTRCQAQHLVAEKARRVPFGHGTTVNGWLGTSSGVALGGQTVAILTAPDNGRNVFRPAALATTAADGTWRAKLRPGPSRLVEAFYGGTSTTEQTVSGQVRLMVPASVRLLSVSPRHVSWGGTVQIVGQLRGGYLPPGGALVRLRIGFGAAYTTYGVQEHVTGNGRFSTTYTFGAGVPGVVRQYWFSIASLPMGDYPWAPANSRRIYVTVG